ncbi:MAG: thiamine biosynthesis protein ThiS [Planctomycetales bacterium 4572_13]|nr:MAG: thiamine biosynthesis protein ThiS [Planctomycetales bacterium 4572_13]
MNATLKINGTEKTFDQGLPSTLTELLAQLEINAATVVAEINGDIVERKNFAQTELKDQMAIELIRFVGGG